MVRHSSGMWSTLGKTKSECASARRHSVPSQTAIMTTGIPITLATEGSVVPGARVLSASVR
jgi:hypothetical protein